MQPVLPKQGHCRGRGAHQHEVGLLWQPPAGRDAVRDPRKGHHRRAPQHGVQVLERALAGDVVGVGGDH